MGALIWLASYPKSGNTWLRSFLCNLLIDAPEPADINKLANFCLGESLRVWYEPHAAAPLETLNAAELARLRPIGQADMMKAFDDSVFVKTHNYLGSWAGTPLHNMDVTAGGIYVLRNPLDVALSAHHHFNLTLDDTIAMMARPSAGTLLSATNIPEVYTDWSGHVRSWTAQPTPQLLVLRYEDLAADPLKHFGIVASFLGLQVSDERLGRAVAHSSFAVLKKQEQEKGFLERPENAKSFFREGRAEQWRDALTPDQIRRIVDDHRLQMQRFSYIPPDYA